MKYDNTNYTLCQHCDHFVDDVDEGAHMEDGEQEFDHNPAPSETHTLAEWKKLRPDLFVEHQDGSIGPNSVHHSRRGKLDQPA